MKRLILLAALLGCSVSASAATSFTVDGTKIAVELPVGYCLPTDELAARMTTFHNADTKNRTFLTLGRCDQLANGVELTQYILIKSPMTARGITMSRERFLTAMGPYADDKDYFSPQKSKEIEAWAENALSKEMKGRVDIEATMQPLGRDELCVYAGFVGSFKFSDEKASVQIGGLCMTTVSGKILTIYWYGRRKDGDTVANLLQKTASFTSHSRANRRTTHEAATDTVEPAQSCGDRSSDRAAKPPFRYLVIDVDPLPTSKLVGHGRKTAR